MARSHGKQGAVQVSGSSGLSMNVTRWELVGSTDVERVLLLTTGTAQRNMTGHAGPTRYSGRVECIADTTAAYDFAEIAGSLVSATFTDGGEQSYSCDIILSDTRISNPSDGLVVLSASFEVSGGIS